jgi:hypothetical protein
MDEVMDLDSAYPMDCNIDPSKKITFVVLIKSYKEVKEEKKK